MRKMFSEKQIKEMIKENAPSPKCKYCYYFYFELSDSEGNDVILTHFSFLSDKIEFSEEPTYIEIVRKIIQNLPAINYVYGYNFDSASSSIYSLYLDGENIVLYDFISSTELSPSTVEAGQVVEQNLETDERIIILEA